MHVNHAYKSTSIMSPSLATLVTCELCRPSVQELRFSSFFLRAAHGRCWRKYLLVQFLSVWAFSTSSLCWMRKYLSDSVSAALYELQLGLLIPQCHRSQSVGKERFDAEVVPFVKNVTEQINKLVKREREWRCGNRCRPFFFAKL